MNKVENPPMGTKLETLTFNGGLRNANGHSLELYETFNHRHKSQIAVNFLGQTTF